MDSSVAVFQEKVQDLAGQYFPTSKSELQEATPLRLKMRIMLPSNLFIDIFYGVSKKRIDFALIKATERIFGIDNLNGWHRHPFGGVKQHEAIEEPTLEEIFSETKTVTTERGSLLEELRWEERLSADSCLLEANKKDSGGE